MQAAEQLHRQLTGESDLRLALLEPEVEEAEEEATDAKGKVSMVKVYTWTHYTGQKSTTKLEMLQTRNDMLDAALDKCGAEGSAEAIVEKVKADYQKGLKEELTVAVAEDEERKAKEAAAAAKAAKKKGKGKK